MTVLFSATLFLNSALLFWLQPMFAKMILPSFGGAPAVWNTCMLFYQSILLAGYAVAHALVRRLGTRGQLAVQGTLFLAAASALPVAVTARWSHPPEAAPVPWLLALLCASVGAPLLAISTNSTLLQSWFSRAGDPRSRDPYFLYQASNLGSLAALLSYPLAIEPLFRLTQQSWLWAGLYSAVFALTIACGAAMRPFEESKQAPRARVPADRATKLRWLMLAFVPSSLLLGATNYLTTSISPVPLLWVVPMAVYLSTFVIAFGRKPWIPIETMVRFQPLLLLPVLFLMATGSTRPISAVLPPHLLLLFVTSMLCHLELAASRPAAEDLTGFYLWIAVGGALGGVFNAILGPLLFKTVAEYPITLALACAVRPTIVGPAQPVWRDLGWPALVGVVCLAISAASQWLHLDLRPLFAVPAVLCLPLKERPLRFAIGVGTVLVLSVPFSKETGRPIHVERSFFGVHRVLLDADRRFHWLTHGGIVHGIQSLAPEDATKPLGYYHEKGPLGQVFRSLGRSLEGGAVAVVGLGTGATACHGRPGQRWTFFEIDPTVERLAKDRRFFSLLENCPVRPGIVLGDARISLAKARPQEYRWIILDAFSSDAIPTHLLTREALSLYLSKLEDHGLILYHISNGYLDLRPVLGDLAQEAGLVALVRDNPVDEAVAKEGQLASTWAVMARTRSDLGVIADDPRWKPLETTRRSPWSDDFSNILSIVRWR